MVPAGHKSLYRNLRLDLHRWLLWQEVLWPPWYLLICWEKSKGFGIPLVSPSPGPYNYLLTKSLFFFSNYQNVRHIWIISELSNKTSPTHVTTNLYTGNLELDTTELTELFEIKEMQYTVKQWERLSTCIVNNAQIVAHLIIYHAC